MKTLLIEINVKDESEERLRQIIHSNITLILEKGKGESIRIDEEVLHQEK